VPYLVYKVPTFAGSRRDDWLAALSQIFFLERLIPELKPMTCCFW